jgi:hypothetical protein
VVRLPERIDDLRHRLRRLERNHKRKQTWTTSQSRPS